MINDEEDNEKDNSLMTTSSQIGIQETQNVSAETTKFCSECGARINARAEICPKCGVPVRGKAGKVMKNPGVAAVLSFFWTGLGRSTTAIYRKESS